MSDDTQNKGTAPKDDPENNRYVDSNYKHWYEQALFKTEEGHDRILSTTTRGARNYFYYVFDAPVTWWRGNNFRKGPDD